MYPSLLPPSSVLFPEATLSFSKGSITGEGENQDELANFEGCFPSKYLACIKGHRWRGWQTAASLVLPWWCPGEGHACSQQYFLLHVWPRWVCLLALKDWDIPKRNWGWGVVWGEFSRQESRAYVLGILSWRYEIRAGFESLSCKVFGRPSILYLHVCRCRQCHIYIYGSIALWVCIYLELKPT